jgi:hypothetical protein
MKMHSEDLWMSSSESKPYWHIKKPTLRDVIKGLFHACHTVYEIVVKFHARDVCIH